MDQKVTQYLTPRGPMTGHLAVVPVTTASVHIDLTGANYLAIAGDINMGLPVMLVADAFTWYRWAITATGETIDETVTNTSGTKANMAFAVGGGLRVTEYPPKGTIGILVKGPVATSLRILRAAQSDVQSIGQ